MFNLQGVSRHEGDLHSYQTATMVSPWKKSNPNTSHLVMLCCQSYFFPNMFQSKPKMPNIFPSSHPPKKNSSPPQKKKNKKKTPIASKKKSSSLSIPIGFPQLPNSPPHLAALLNATMYGSKLRVERLLGVNVSAKRTHWKSLKVSRSSTIFGPLPPPIHSLGFPLVDPASQHSAILVAQPRAQKGDLDQDKTRNWQPSGCAQAPKKSFFNSSNRIISTLVWIENLFEIIL